MGLTEKHKYDFRDHSIPKVTDLWYSMRIQKNYLDKYIIVQKKALDKGLDPIILYFTF